MTHSAPRKAYKTMNNDNTTSAITIGTQCLVSSHVSPDGCRTWHLYDDNTPRRFTLLEIVPDSEDGITPVYVFWAPDGHAPNMGKYRHEIEPFDNQLLDCTIAQLGEEMSLLERRPALYD